MDLPYNSECTILKSGSRGHEGVREKTTRSLARHGSGLGRGRDKKEGRIALYALCSSRRGTRPQPFRIATDSSISNRRSPARSRHLSLLFSLFRPYAARLPATPRSCKAPPSIICRKARGRRHPILLLLLLPSWPPHVRHYPPLRIAYNPTSGNYFGIHRFHCGIKRFRERLSHGPMIDRACVCHSRLVLHPCAGFLARKLLFENFTQIFTLKRAPIL